MKKLLLIILFFSFSTLVFSDEDEGTLFLKEVEKLNSHKYSQKYVGNGTSSNYSLRYTKHEEELQRFKKIVSSYISNNKRAINKWSKGTFHLIEKKNYGKTYKDYNVYFGNGSVIFKENNFLTTESVYIMTQIPNESFNCIEGNPVKRSWKEEYWYEHPGIVKIDELEWENFYVFPYFDEKEPSIAVAVGYTSSTGNGAMYYIIFSTTSDKYHITDYQDCGEIPSEIPHNTNDWKDIYATGQETCERVIEFCDYNFFNVNCESQTSYVQGIITGFNRDNQKYIGEKGIKSHASIKMGLIQYCKRYPDKDTIDAAVAIYRFLVDERCGDGILCLGE